MTTFKLFLPVVFIFTATAMRAEVATRTDIRKEILRSFPYCPSAEQISNQKPTISESEPIAISDPAIIVLPKYEVKSRPLPRGLAEAIAKSRPLGPQNHSKFGTGLHQKDFGKVRLSAVTILYIPIAVGLSW